MMSKSFIMAAVFMSFATWSVGQEICDNSIDDDNDGLIDLNDNECQCQDTIPLTSVTGSICTDNLKLTLNTPGVTSYQWYQDGIAVIGETGPQIVLQESSIVEGSYELLIQDATGCHITQAYEVIVPVYMVDLGVREICQGESVQFGAFSISVPGFFQNNTPAADGCDSITSLEVIVHLHTFGVVRDTFCEGTLYELGTLQTYETGSHEAIIENVNGCDSIVSLELYHHLNTYNAFETMICEGDVYNNGSLSTSEEGTYDIVLVNANGCDSIVTVDLAVELTTFSTDFAEICFDHVYDFHGTLLDSTGVYETTLQNQNGCDSIVSLELIVDDVLVETVEASICEGEVFQLNEVVATESGEYVSMVNGLDGCDSTIFINLTVHQATSYEYSQSVCSGGVLDFNGIFIDSPGTYEAIIPNQYGCDSTITVEVTFDAPVESLSSDRICEGDILDFHGQEISTEGFYQAMLTTPEGCDSIVGMDVIVLYPVIEEVAASICEEESYEFFQDELVEPGMYEQTLTSSLGCDSIVSLELEVLPLNRRQMSDAICDGNAVIFYGEALYEEGVYEKRFSNIDQCDSLVTLVLSVTKLEDGIDLADQITINYGHPADIIPLFADSNIVDYEWVDDYGDVLGQDPVLSDFSPTQSMWVHVYGKDDVGCPVYDKIFVNLELDIRIFIPNIFSPNADGINDYFSISSNDAVESMEELLIYDRWGSLKYSDSYQGMLTDYQGWDGKFNGNYVESGVYAYFAIFNMIDGSMIKEKGSVTVLR